MISKEVTPNPSEIKAIKEDALQRYSYFLNQKDDESASKYVFENLYESIRELAECVCLSKGMRILGHEQTIHFLMKERVLTDTEGSLFDTLRKLRNQSKYYGKKVSQDRLIETLSDIERLKSILLKNV